MKVEQRLASGLSIRQDFRSAVRFVIFETHVPEWEYATHGGTAFLVSFHGKPYAVIPRHVFGDFDWRQLRITEAKFGRFFAKLKSIVYPSSPRGEAIDSDITDLAVIEFADDVSLSFSQTRHTCSIPAPAKPARRATSWS